VVGSIPAGVEETAAKLDHRNFDPKIPLRLIKGKF
jgi:hypothetical protein